MKSILMTLLCALTLAQSGKCEAFTNTKEIIYVSYDRGLYLKGFGGVNLTQKTQWKHAKYRAETGYIVGAALGYKLNFLSAEGEFSYRYNSIDRLAIDALNLHVTGDIEQFCGFGNILCNIPLTDTFTPYIGAGAGYRHIKPGVNFDQSSDTTFENFINTANEWGVYQAIGGLNFVVSRMVNLQVEYRYMDGWSSVKCSNHTVDLAAKILF